MCDGETAQNGDDLQVKAVQICIELPCLERFLSPSYQIQLVLARVNVRQTSWELMSMRSPDLEIWSETISSITGSWLAEKYRESHENSNMTTLTRPLISGPYRILIVFHESDIVPVKSGRTYQQSSFPASPQTWARFLEMELSLEQGSPDSCALVPWPCLEC